ncbi:hypothetical protein PV04_09593 [Phialophora macrospora]|uniref:Uncharacterized protein n=1 Tax=Phialophora macrospora TaxID=1851006 RepID=A0A0D2FCU2_9EURO|nr:hypothetical protein PV04_09593 [Phialophora macrospora]
MRRSILLAAAVALLGPVAAVPIEIESEHPHDIQGSALPSYDLAIGGGRFDMSELQSFSLFYANNSAYIGQIKYQAYSEPLIVSGAQHDIDTLTFQSIHSSPTGWQQMYVTPRQSKPVGFTTPHASPPHGVRVDEFSFNWDRSGLQNHGRNLFYACRDAGGKLAKLHSYQIWWIGDGFPSRWSCKGPINISAADGCARSL